MGMKRTGIATLPLHGGKAPHWLFSRMTKLAREIVGVVVSEFGPEDMLRRLSEPHWFQALGCTLGFDWHSSGVTTTTCGAIKEGIRGLEHELGLFAAGGKGGRSRHTPQEIEAAAGGIGDPRPLVAASRLSAKVDSSCLQDGYQVYHHAFFFTSRGAWAVVQQGMNGQTGLARRYHWLGEGVRSFVEEPHAAICAARREACVLDLTACASAAVRGFSIQLVREDPERLLRELTLAKRAVSLPRRHAVLAADINPARLRSTLLATYEAQPATFQDLVALPGVGAKTLRALALLSELIWGAEASFTDPARFSFAHGGKDGHPYPVDRVAYDQSIEVLGRALRRARVGEGERLAGLRRLEALGRSISLTTPCCRDYV
jgi:hypothetical protein